MFSSKKQLTILELLNNELTRLHDELDSFEWSSGAPLTPDTKDCYLAILKEIEKLNISLSELAKNEPRN